MSERKRPEQGHQDYYGNQQRGRGADEQGYYGDPQGDYGTNDQRYYGNPQGGYTGNPEGYYGEQRGYYGQQQGAYTGNTQEYYGNPQDSYGANSQGYYGDPRGGYNANGQGYYGDPQNGYPQNGYPQNGYPENNRGRKPERNRKKKKKHRKVIFIIELIVLLIVAAGFFAFAQLGKMKRVKLKDILVNVGAEITTSGYKNIALFGVDSREGNLEGSTNSDTIMVASINQKTGEIKLVSVYRDTYLDRTDGTYGKATECFAAGGAQRAVNMLNKNLDLDIQDFMTIDFNGVIEAVDLLGGIELDITEEERGWLNGYLVETSQVTGVAYDEVPYAGYQTVSGIQAMAYCRIRYTEGWDYKRTERQRTVLGKLFQKAKEKGVSGLIPMVNTMMGYISTSLSNTEIISLVSGIAKYTITETAGFPFEKMPADVPGAGDCVVPVNLAANVTELHRQMFGKESYTPSQTVQEISNQIINNTGIQ